MYEVCCDKPYCQDISIKKQPFSSKCKLLRLLNKKYTKYLVSFQEELEAKAKADKIKLALEKLKEAKVKKVSCKTVNAAIRATT